MTREEAVKLLVNATYSDDWQGNEDLTTAHNMAIKALERKSYIEGYNKAMSNIYLAYNKSEYPEYTEDYIYQELNKWEKEGVPNEQ